jgi:hypothetical protein
MKKVILSLSLVLALTSCKVEFDESAVTSKTLNELIVSSADYIYESDLHFNVEDHITVKDAEENDYYYAAISAHWNKHINDYITDYYGGLINDDGELVSFTYIDLSSYYNEERAKYLLTSTDIIPTVVEDLIKDMGESKENITNLWIEPDYSKTFFRLEFKNGKYIDKTIKFNRDNTEWEYLVK